MSVNTSTQLDQFVLLLNTARSLATPKAADYGVADIGFTIDEDLERNATTTCTIRTPLGNRSYTLNLNDKDGQLGTAEKISTMILDNVNKAILASIQSFAGQLKQSLGQMPKFAIRKECGVIDSVSVKVDIITTQIFIPSKDFLQKPTVTLVQEINQLILSHDTLITT